MRPSYSRGLSSQPCGGSFHALHWLPRGHLEVGPCGTVSAPPLIIAPLLCPVVAGGGQVWHPSAHSILAHIQRLRWACSIAECFTPKSNAQWLTRTCKFCSTSVWTCRPILKSTSTLPGLQKHGVTKMRSGYSIVNIQCFFLPPFIWSSSNVSGLRWEIIWVQVHSFSEEFKNQTFYA